MSLKTNYKMMSFNGIEVRTTRSINSDYRMLTLCKPYVEQYDEVSKEFDALTGDEPNAAELLLEGIGRVEAAWAKVAAGWALATQDINPSLRCDLPRIIKSGAAYHIDFIRGHINDALAYLTDANGELFSEEKINGAIKAQRDYEDEDEERTHARHHAEQGAR